MSTPASQASQAAPKPVAAVQPAASVPSVAHAPGSLSARAPVEPEFPLPGATRVTLDQLVAVLRKSTTVAQREWAAENLVNFNWQDSPVVADTLLKAAREDSASTVRVACVRSLMKMGVYTASARAVFQSLKNDADSRVRLEAEAALRNLGAN
jgi:HEAT repeats